MAQKSSKAVTEADEKEFTWIRALAAILDETGLTEIEIEKSDVKVRVARGGVVHAAPQIAAAPAPVAPAAAPSEPAAPAAQRAGAVKSPMVGTVYLASSPGADNFVSVGSRVSEGQTLMIIEAMKTMNAVAAPKAGVVAEILVQNEQPVEFGEPLIIIE